MENLENKKRVEVLYRKHYGDMLKYANRLTHNEEESEDLIMSIIVSLLEKPKPKLWYKNSFNLFYINKVIYSRFINRVREINLTVEFIDNYNLIDEVYDMEQDSIEEQLMNAYIETVNETKDKNIDKYADLYIKYKLYGLSIRNCITVSHRNKDTIYQHFKFLNDWVLKCYTEKSENILENALNG